MVPDHLNLNCSYEMSQSDGPKKTGKTWEKMKNGTKNKGAWMILTLEEF